MLAESRGSTPADRHLWREGVYDEIRDAVARRFEHRADVPIGPDGESQTRGTNNEDGQPVDDPKSRLRQVADRDHELEIYLNLASRMNVRGPNQLWIADITSLTCV